MKKISPFSSMMEMLSAFPDDATCREYLEAKRWGGVATCPYCQSQRSYTLKTKGVFKGMYKCAEKGCQKRYTVTIGTMFEGSHIGLRKWFVALYIFALHKKGISSHQLAVDLGITQKSAWYMLHRIREAYNQDDTELMGGEGVVVECDETVVGGKVSNMHMSKRKELAVAGRIHANKSNVMGQLERGGKLRMIVMKPGDTAASYVAGGVAFDSVLMTDSAMAYKKLGESYAAHFTTDHDAKEYARDKVIHTNTIEGAFSLFDRMVLGIYHHVSAKHLQAYCNEHEFRYNSRKWSVSERFDQALFTSKKLPYSVLIAK